MTYPAELVEKNIQIWSDRLQSGLPQKEAQETAKEIVQREKDLDQYRQEAVVFRQMMEEIKEAGYEDPFEFIDSARALMANLPSKK